MEPSNWAPEHSGALRDYVLKGLSFSDIAREINRTFGTAYTKSAVLGRARRMGLSVQPRVDSPSIVPSLATAAQEDCVPSRQSLPHALQQPPQTAFRPAEPVKLRCVGVRPRLISLLELESDDCRYPYGGDKEGEEITFCGHPRRRGSSYCAPHFRLTWGPGTVSERAAVVLRIVRVA
ncbi:hypothetical protein JQ596_12180 [Bradyrhizobium manausense]|uniref:GcrA family cell cycle regulator n=1 Tax=Bradyrhizobium TaxID=374 RepID=UPI001BAAED62|nr:MULTISPECIES: GcrA family cell cycle regulator [Bradyrhizobium]MBR0826298.1 hypothetical protein [Bradyrhizobium manausense]UVO31695.1 GcrA family cell cycle regulator [Bradyrhizobium arachidis]